MLIDRGKTGSREMRIIKSSAWQKSPSGTVQRPLDHSHVHDAFPLSLFIHLLTPIFIISLDRTLIISFIS